jgi:pyrimidine deaminase RibD-like protein
MATRKSRKHTPPVIKDFAAAAAARDIISSDDDRRFAQLAIDEAVKSTPEDERPHPKVGAVVVKNGEILAQAHRGEFPKSHAEFIALEKKLADKQISGATVYTTLEPCTVRNDPRVACALRLVERKVSRVVIGILDPNRAVLGQGWETLHDAGIETQFFPHDLMNQVTELNRDFIRAQKANRSSGNRTIKWTPNISQLTYINRPASRKSQVCRVSR